MNRHAEPKKEPGRGVVAKLGTSDAARTWSDHKKLARELASRASPTHRRYATRDGVLEKSPSKDGRPASPDHGDSTIRAKYGDYRWGRTVGDGRDLQVSEPGGESPDAPSLARYLCSPRTHLPIAPDLYDTAAGRRGEQSAIEQLCCD